MTNETMFEKLDTALAEYLQHLRDGGERLQLPPVKRSEDEEFWVWASSVGWCPFLANFRRLGVPQFNPKTERQERDSQFKMATGERIAELLQEAMLWRYGSTPEVQAAHADWGVRGRVDILHEDDDGLFAVEIKTSAYAQPSWGHVVQALIYKIALNAKYGYIVLANPMFANEEKGKPPFVCWRIEESGGGYLVYDEITGELWNSYRNGPATLNDAAIQRAIEEHKDVHAMMAAVDPQAIGPDTFLPPFGLDHEDAWLCRRVTSKPKRYAKKYTYHKGQADEQVYEAGQVRPGVAVPLCEYFCHSTHPSPFPITLVMDGDGVDHEVYQPELEAHYAEEDADVL